MTMWSHIPITNMQNACRLAGKEFNYMIFFIHKCLRSTKWQTEKHTSILWRG